MRIVPGAILLVGGIPAIFLVVRPADSSYPAGASAIPPAASVRRAPRDRGSASVPPAVTIAPLRVQVASLERAVADFDEEPGQGPCRDLSQVDCRDHPHTQLSPSPPGPSRPLTPATSRLRC